MLWVPFIEGIKKRKILEILWNLYSHYSNAVNAPKGQISAYFMYSIHKHLPTISLS